MQKVTTVSENMTYTNAIIAHAILVFRLAFRNVVSRNSLVPSILRVSVRWRRDWSEQWQMNPILLLGDRVKMS